MWVGEACHDRKVTSATFRREVGVFLRLSLGLLLSLLCPKKKGRQG